MNEADPSEPKGSRSVTGEVRKNNALLITHDDPFDRASSSNKNAYLASNFSRNFGKEPGDLKGNHPMGRDSSSVDVLDLPDLARL
jgi:hypothetical protein